jgi:8-oxo-dGTP diphosphatase
MKEYKYEYPRPALTVDIIVLRNVCTDPEILLIKRLKSPFKDSWALPGGFVDMDETLEQAALRELKEETGVNDIILNQFKAYSDINRDPRGRTISMVFIGISKIDIEVIAGDDAKEASWFSINNLPQLAFDHTLIIKEAKGIL